MRRLGLIALLVALGIGVGSAVTEAGPRHGAYRHRYSRPIYHPPSFHYDYVPHDRLHWTPWRGLHIDRHYHAVPHYVPGHFDRWHGDHIDENPWFHH